MQRIGLITDIGLFLSPDFGARSPIRGQSTGKKPGTCLPYLERNTRLTPAPRRKHRVYTTISAEWGQL